MALKPQEVSTLVKEFPDTAISELTEVAALLGIWGAETDGKLADPTPSVLDRYCEVVQANVGAPIDRRLAEGIFIRAYNAQQQATDSER